MQLSTWLTPKLPRRWIHFQWLWGNLPRHICINHTKKTSNDTRTTWQSFCSSPLIKGSRNIMQCTFQITKQCNNNVKLTLTVFHPRLHKLYVCFKLLSTKHKISYKISTKHTNNITDRKWRKLKKYTYNM